jgi:DNA helicase-2/ATP-dependent DNA helicase PcrA
MKDIHLTDEQQAVIHHPIGMHARVLAVAGSGKSYTMACRIKHLVMDCHSPPHAMRVLMFNTLARQQFRSHLKQTGLPEVLQPEVHTFHSFSYQVIREMVRMDVLPGLTQFWTGEKKELIWLTVKRAIESLERQKQIPLESVESEEALNAFSLWKGAFLPPDRAGSYTSPYLPLVYREFERMRLEKSALTFDDFIPLAIEILETNPDAHHRWCGPVQHLIVDEYQDVNRGQQRLLELLADGKADVMVVGDVGQPLDGIRSVYPDHSFLFHPRLSGDNHLICDQYPVPLYDRCCQDGGNRLEPVAQRCGDDRRWLGGSYDHLRAGADLWTGRLRINTICQRRKLWMKYESTIVA